jgi:hypothetical protein
MIASITFTYQVDSRNPNQVHDREELFYYRSKDKAYNLFKNKLDYNLYIFHNCRKDYAKNIVNKYLQNENNYSYILWDTYPKAFEFALNHLKDIGAKKIIFMQDDVFSCGRSLGADWDYGSDRALYAYDELASYLKQTKLNYINLEEFDRNKNIQVVESLHSFDVLKTDTQFFRSKNLWSFDDSTYFATIDYAIDHIYDNEYYAKKDIWEAESYLKFKFDQLNIDKFITNQAFFKRFYLVGPNSAPFRKDYLSKINEIIK